MNSRGRYFSGRMVLISLLLLIASLSAGCGGEADVVNPTAISVSLPVSATGTVYPVIQSTYPSNGSSGIPITSDIVVVFSRPIDSATVLANISISPATPYAFTMACDNRAVVINPATDLSYSTAYTVSISAGILEETYGTALSAAGSFAFTTAADSFTSLQPRVIVATRYPGSGDTVDIGQSYVEVTFTEAVANVPGNFTVYAGATNMQLSAPTTSDNKTWRFNIDTALADYSTTYTVTLVTDSVTPTNGIYKLSDNTSPLYNSDLTWTYSTESDPASATVVVNDIWVTAVTPTTATVKFTTSKPVRLDNCYAVYDTASGVAIGDPQFQESASTATSTLHTVTVTGLTPSTRYYFRGGVNTGGTATIDEIGATEINFYTAANAAVNTDLATTGVQSGLQVLQTNGVGSYAFWINDSSTINGQFFSATTGLPVWNDPDGVSIATAGTRSSLVAITDGFAEAVLVYNNNTALYGKLVYDNAGTHTIRWGGAAGTSLGLTMKSGSSFSACIVHERPDTITSVTGQTEMPDNGTAANLLYDADVNFSAYTSLWLDVNDLLLTGISNATDIAWNSYAIENQDGGTSPSDTFPYVLKSTAANPNLSAITNYYIADIDVTISGTAIASTATELRSTGTNLLTVAAGDIIYTSNNEWCFAFAAGAWNGTYFYVTLDRSITPLTVTDTFTIYTNHAGPFTSEAVTNPLWDTASTPLFDPGVTVLAGDYVVNENNNTAAATCDTVDTINLSMDTDYALRLSSSDIMNSVNIYTIVRLPSGFTYKAVGYSTTTPDFTLTDSHGPFGSVSVGDIVFNIDQNLSAMVTASAAGALTLTADIFNAASDKAIVYTKRGFLVAYVDSANYIRAGVYNISDGSVITSGFDVCSSSANSNPVAVSDGAGNALIFYEKGGNIYAKKVSAKGEFFSAWSPDAADAGRLILSGYTIVQALPDKALNTTGGAYLLAVNSAGTAYRLLRINGVSGGTTTDTGNVPGLDPQMTIDSISGAINRAVVVYRVVGTTYYYIRAVAYNGAAVSWGPNNISDPAAGYNCYKPSVTMANNTIAADEIYVSWFDGRFFTPAGYSVYAQRLNNTGVYQWTQYGIFLSTPTTKVYDNPLSMKLLYFYDDATAPYGLLPIWLDYRGGSADLYYQKVSEAPVFIP